MPEKNYIHEIRNMRELTKDDLKNIEKLGNVEKMEIIKTFNEIQQWLMKNLMNIDEKDEKDKKK